MFCTIGLKNFEDLLLAQLFNANECVSHETSATIAGAEKIKRSICLRNLFGANEDPLTSEPSQPAIIDYEGSQYRTEFWEGQGRDYEDLTERLAIKRLLPARDGIIMEAGAGFGRLASLYDGFERVILMDYSLSLLQEARKIWGEDRRFVFVAASIYELPFVDNLLDALVMIRVMHHLQAPQTALNELARVLQGGKPFVMEYANKRNLKAIARYWMRRQSWNPFDPEPYEFVSLNFDFHPNWVSQRLETAGFRRESELAISNFRSDTVKRRIPAFWLARLDNALAAPGAALKLSPSIMMRCRKAGQPDSHQGFFRCPSCGNAYLNETPKGINCKVCDKCWPNIDGIYDFRTTKVAE